MIKHHVNKQLRNERVYLILQPTVLHWAKSGQELKQRPRDPASWHTQFAFFALAFVQLIKNLIRTVTQFTFTYGGWEGEKGVGEWILVHLWTLWELQSPGIVLYQKRSRTPFTDCPVPNPVIVLSLSSSVTNNEWGQASILSRKTGYCLFLLIWLYFFLSNLLSKWFRCGRLPLMLQTNHKVALLKCLW